MLLDQATMPDAAVIAAGAALAGDVPALAMSVGNPARVIRVRGEEAESE